MSFLLFKAVKDHLGCLFYPIYLGFIIILIVFWFSLKTSDRTSYIIPYAGTYYKVIGKYVLTLFEVGLIRGSQSSRQLLQGVRTKVANVCPPQKQQQQACLPFIFHVNKGTSGFRNCHESLYLRNKC